MSHVVQTFRCTQTLQTFVVPAGVSSIFMELWGGSDGARFSGLNMASHSGQGYVSGTLTVTPGDTYNIYVGGKGEAYKPTTTSGQTVTSKGGYNGGGAGGSAVGNGSYNVYSGSGGGGATDVRYGGTALSNRILVAPGSGGTAIAQWWAMTQNSTIPPSIANPTSPNPPYLGTADDYYFNPTAPNQCGQGGYGGSSHGAHGGGTVNTGGPYTNGGGGGASMTGGGSAGNALPSHATVGNAGSLGVGGAGGSLTKSQTASDGHHYAGGGGGGGYYGGGGGATDNGAAYSKNGSWSAGGGGGGSQYISTSFANRLGYGHTMNRLALQGEVYYDGLAIFTYDQPPETPNVVGVLDGQFVDSTAPFEIQWEYSSPDIETYQYGFEVDYQVTGGSSWTAYVDARSSASGYTFPANTFTPGTNYTIRMRYFDNTGDPSAFFTFTIAPGLPNAAPTITYPAAGDSILDSPFTITWEAIANEALYSIDIIDRSGGPTDGNVLFTNNELSSTRENFAWSANGDTAVHHTDSGSGLTGMDNWYVVDNASLGITLTTSNTCNARGLATGGTAKAFEVNWGSAGTNTDNGWLTYDWINTVPGRTYNITVGFTRGADGASEVQLAASAGGSGESGAATTQSNWFGDTSNPALATGAWNWLTLQFVATTTITYVQLLPQSSSVGTNTGFFDALLVEQGAGNTPVASGAAYFDGGNANGQPGTASWENDFGNGVPGNGTSQLVPASPVSSYSIDWTDTYGLQSTDVEVQLKYVAVGEGSAGAWSQIASVDCSINMSPPETPQVSMLADNLTGSITLAITNPAGTYPAIYNDVYRTDITNGGEEIRIATNLAPSTNFVDFTPATMTTYQYRVRAYSQPGGFADAT